MGQELRDYLRVLRTRKWYVILALFSAVVVGAVTTARATPIYRAETKLFVGQRQVSVADLSSGVAVLQLSQSLLKSYASLVQTRPIAERAVQVDNLPISPATLATSIQAAPVPDTQLLVLGFDSADPALAKRVLDAVARAFLIEVERIETSPTASSEPAVRVSIVEPAIQPAAPYKPNVRQNMALAAVLGLLAGLGVAFLVEYLDNTPKERDEVESLAGAPVLAGIPRIEGAGNEPAEETNPQSPPSEAFRMLRTATQFLGVDNPIKLILITSPSAREGKSTVALNLAETFAENGSRTVLLQADLRRPSLGNVFPSGGQGSLTACLIGRSDVDESRLPTPIRNLDFVPSGPIPPNPVELLASDRMTEILERLRKDADVVIIDSPPMLPVADASVLASRVDGVILVVRAGKSRRDHIRDAASALGKSGGRILGVVLNAVGPGDSQYGYYYGYGYRSQAQPASAPGTPAR